MNQTPVPNVAAPAVRRSPLQFGLRTLLLLMAVCSLQFAAMNYLGVLGGMVLGTALLCAAFAAVFVAGLCLPVTNAAGQVRRLDRLIVWLMMGILVLFFGTALAGGGLLAWTVVEDVLREGRFERQIGATLRSESLLVPTANGADSQWVLRITSVEAGGLADQAGLKAQEAIVLSGTTDEFYDMLDEAAGQQIVLTIATALGISISPSNTRSVSLTLPK
jgi:hypothetical protein